jgi:hypothetical protein
MKKLIQLFCAGCVCTMFLAGCKDDDAAVSAEYIVLEQTNVQLMINQTVQLKAFVMPDDAADKTLAWRSDNDAIASVADGLVTAVSRGTAKITVSAVANPAAKAEVTVTVSADEEVPLEPSADRLPVVAYLINDPYSAYADIGYSRRKTSGGTDKTWPDGGEPGKDMVDAGVTHIWFATFNHTEVSGAQTADMSVRIPKVRAVLDICQEYGLKAIVPFADAGHRDWEAIVNGSLDVSGLFSQLSTHPAVFAWAGIDEPANDQTQFNFIASLKALVASYDSNHPLYNNLLPNYASGLTAAASYRSYVHNYLQTVHPPFLSFDSYPLTGQAASVEQGFYENLQIIADEAKAEGIPFWAFANTSAFASQSAPTRQNLRFQVFTNLAYGAQCIQYFAWWTGDANFHTALFGEATTGNRTAYYDEVKVVGLEIKNLSRVFKDATVQQVWFHAGSGLQPRGTVAFDVANLPDVFKSFTIGEGGRALISLMEKGDKNYLVIVNGSPAFDLRLNVETAGSVREITKNNTAVYASGVQPKTLTGGDILIYEWPK